MNKLLVILIALVVISFVVSGCGETNTNNGTSGGANGAKTGTEDWCKAGSSWSWSGAEGSASWIIKGLETYKGDIYCHVTAQSSGTGEDYIIEYYYKEVDGEMTDIWMIMKDKSGKVISESHVTG